MKIENILEEALILVRRYPELRVGQAVWNVAVETVCHLEPLAGGDLDPFHDDSRVGAFLQELHRREAAGDLRWLR